MLRASEPAGRILKLPGATIAVGIRRQMHSGGKRTLVVAIAAAEKADNACGLTVVAAPKSNKLEFLGHRFSETEGGLHSLCAAREQLDVGDAFGQQPADQIEKTGTSFGRETAEGDNAPVVR